MHFTIRGESIFPPTMHAFYKQFSKNVPIMLKKVPIMPVFFFSTKYPFLTITNMYSTFHARSEGLGDFSLLNNEMTPNVYFLAELSGTLWLASRAVDSCWATTTTSTRSAIDLQSTTPFDEQYMCIISAKLPDYS